MNTPYPLPSHKPYTPVRVHQLFRAAGITLAQWATSNGYKPQDVYLVTGGRVKARHGRSHDIAVKLGLKLPVEKLNAA